MSHAQSKRYGMAQRTMPRALERVEMSDVMPASDLRALAEQSNAWPFEQAQADRRAPEEDAEGRGAVRDRLRPLRPAAYRHLRRGRAHHHGAPRLSRADRRQDQDPAARLFRRHGRPAQGAGQCAQQGAAGAASRQAADAGAAIPSAPIRASASTTMRGCAPSSTPSASTTNSPVRPTTTPRAASTRRC